MCTLGSLDMLNMSAISHNPEDGEVLFLPRSPRIGRLNTYSLVKGYVHTVDVVPDGYCGFRVVAYLMLDDENEFPKVKAAMLNELSDNMDIYRHHFHYPVEELQEIVAMGHNYETAKHGHL